MPVGWVEIAPVDHGTAITSRVVAEGDIDERRVARAAIAIVIHRPTAIAGRVAAKDHVNQGRVASARIGPTEHCPTPAGCVVAEGDVGQPGIART